MLFIVMLRPSPIHFIPQAWALFLAIRDKEKEKIRFHPTCAYPKPQAQLPSTMGSLRQRSLQKNYGFSQYKDKGTAIYCYCSYWSPVFMNGHHYLHQRTLSRKSDKTILPKIFPLLILLSLPILRRLHCCCIDEFR